MDYHVTIELELMDKLQSPDSVDGINEALTQVETLINRLVERHLMGLLTAEHAHVLQTEIGPKFVRLIADSCDVSASAGQWLVEDVEAAQKNDDEEWAAQVREINPRYPGA